MIYRYIKVISTYIIYICFMYIMYIMHIMYINIYIHNTVMIYSEHQGQLLGPFNFCYDLDTSGVSKFDQAEAL
jgi:HD superfamily phosphohydrolase